MKKGCLVALLAGVFVSSAVLVMFIVLGNRADRQSLGFTPPPENITVQIKHDKFSGQTIYSVGPLLVSFNEKADEPLLMAVNIHYVEGNKKPLRAVLLFTAKTVNVGELKYQPGDLVYALADGERVISEQLTMLKDEVPYWGSIDRLQGFTLDTSGQVLEKLAKAKKVEFRVSRTEFRFKPEHQKALGALLAEASKGS